MTDYSRDGNQIVVEEVDVEDKNTYVVCVVNGKCICFEKGLLDFSKCDDVDELLKTSANMGLGTDESELMYPMIYGNANTFVELLPSVYRGGRCFSATVGHIDGLPNDLCKCVRCWIDEYAKV